MKQKQWAVHVEAIGYIGKVTEANEELARAAALSAYGECGNRGGNFATWAIFEDDEFSVSPV